MLRFEGEGGLCHGPPLSTAPEPTKADMQLSMTCARGDPVRPELIQEAAMDVWIPCNQIFVVAWSSWLRAKIRSRSGICSCLAQLIDADLFTITQIRNGVSGWQSTCAVKNSQSPENEHVSVMS